MIVATEKRKNNIAEYILYLWQIEDTIRALKFDMEQIDQLLVQQYDVDDAKKKEVYDWYANLVVGMQKEQKQTSGHLQFLVNLVNDLNDFHLALIQRNTDANYTAMYNEIKPDIELVRKKSNLDHNDVQVSLNTLYIILMLKMKQQEVTEGTQTAVFKFGNFMGHLAKLYKDYENGDLEME